MKQKIKHAKGFAKMAVVFGLTIALMATWFMVPTGKAATITSREVRVSNPVSSGVSAYDFAGNFPDTVTPVRCIKVEYCTTQTGACSGPTGLTTVGGSVVAAGWNTFTPGQFTYASTAANSFTLVHSGAGQAASSSASFVASLTNPSNPGTYFAKMYTYSNADCATGLLDNGIVGFAIMNGVNVSATIDPALTFTVAGANPATCTVNGGTETDTSASNASINYNAGAPLAADTFYDACQRLEVDTNSTNGYTVSIQESDQLTYGSEQIADGSGDGTVTDTTEGEWATANNNGFAYCMDDLGTNVAAQNADAGWGTNGCGAGTQNFKTLADRGAAETAQSIMSNTAEAEDHAALVGYRLSVPASQPAGTYTNVLSYIATPNY